MKKEYSKPIVEKLVFDYAQVVIASGTVIHGDFGHGRGCGRDVTSQGRPCN